MITFLFEATGNIKKEALYELKRFFRKIDFTIIRFKVVQVLSGDL